MARFPYVLIVPVIVIVVSSTLLVQDFRSEGVATLSGEAPLAAVKLAVGDVKRKPPKRMVWFDLRTSASVFRNESVRTAKGSSATIVFPDGASIEVGESSLIVLEVTKNKVAVDFVSGNIFSK